MMKKFFKALTFIAVPVMAASILLAGCNGCGKKVKTEIGNIMQDIEVAPTQKAYYEDYTKQALADYMAVAEQHCDDFGDIDYENADVQAVGKTAAAKMFAYACYNERQLDQYVFFSHTKGDTDLGTNGSGTALRQEYYLRVNETEKSCGYRYHYSIKKVEDAKGFISTFKNLFETASLRFSDQTDLLYRFSGSDIRYGKQNDTLGRQLLICDWKTDTTKGDWGTHELKIQKREPVVPDAIEADINANAGLDIKGQDTTTIRGNINILAENIIKYTSISVDENDGCIIIMLTVDTDVANRDDASLKMLRQANDSSNCRWVAGENSEDATGIGEDTGYRIICRLWPNGLFRNYVIAERWSGKIQGFSGAADSTTYFYYSYSDRDCDMTNNLKMLEEGKKLVNKG